MKVGRGGPNAVERRSDITERGRSLRELTVKRSLEPVDEAIGITVTLAGQLGVGLYLAEGNDAVGITPVIAVGSGVVTTIVCSAAWQKHTTEVFIPAPVSITI